VKAVVSSPLPRTDWNGSLPSVDLCSACRLVVTSGESKRITLPVVWYDVDALWSK